MMSAGPSLALPMWDIRGARFSPAAALMAWVIAWIGCCIGSFWFAFARVDDGAMTAAVSVDVLVQLMALTG